MTVITISTVGFQEIREMGPEGKIFSMVLIFMSIGTVGYLVSNIVSMVMEGEVKEAWRVKKMEKEIRQLKDHYIICGAGKTGLFIVKQFTKEKIPFVVIEKDKEALEELKSLGVLHVEGDATQESILLKANLQEAKGLVAALPKDSENVYTVLTARHMNEKLFIIARAVDEHSVEKLTRAGANNTVSPYEIGGMRIASMMLRPSVISFLDGITHAGKMTLQLEEVYVREGSSLAGKTLMEARILEKTGLIVLALGKEKEEDVMFNPSSTEILGPGETMIVLGREEQIKKLQDIAK